MNILSIGRTAQELHIGVALVQRLVSELGIKPALVIDDIPYYHRGDVTMMRSHLGDKPATPGA